MKQQRIITKLLIANRSEIASRISATARTLGITTVAVYTEEDKFAPFIFEAHEAYQLPKAGYEGYTSIDDIISCAQSCGANAIHPGYGFLSESPDFAQAVIDAGLIWVGPHVQALKEMGNKSQACKTMKDAGIPIIPGFSCNALQSNAQEEAREAFKMFNGPALLKAAAGGGGKAMHIISNTEEFDAIWSRTLRESQTLFNSSELLLEKYIDRARHVEVQIAGDGENYIHLFDRECSIQRRHQKLIEEARCHFISENSRTQLYNYALRAAHAINYDSIGTLEFLVTDNEEIYFLEMNTRIQVEHPITEMISGIDLVALQLEIAQTQRVPYAQTEIVSRGHSIECRIIAENPSKNFIPSTGTISLLSLPKGPFLRVDHALEQGSEVTPFFDSMIAKVITVGETREKARLLMIDALQQLKVQGIATNISLLISLLLHQNFITGDVHTQWLEENFFSLLEQSRSFSNDDLCATTLFLSLTMKKKSAVSHRWGQKPWK